MDGHKKQNFVTAVLFLGIILTGLIYLSMTAAFANPNSLAADNVYGEPDVGEDTLFSRFNDAVYKNVKLKQAISANRYNIFSDIDCDNVIVGKDGFLFDYYDEENAYSYIKDYAGCSAPSEEELLALLAESISLRREAYEAMGCVYVLAVIPNLQTVYSDCMPFYYGDISENTRLSLLTKYLEENGETCFLNLTDALVAAKPNGQLYNNTENSLNARGAYYAYLAVMDKLPEQAKEGCSLYGGAELSFNTHPTDGKSTARTAEAESIVCNRTVSIACGVKTSTYLTIERYWDLTVDYTLVKYKSMIPQKMSVMVAFPKGDNWDKILMEPYFSNTYGRAGYKLTHDFNPADKTRLAPQTVVQFIHENELIQLIDAATTATYTAALSAVTDMTSVDAASSENPAVGIN